MSGLTVQGPQEAPQLQGLHDVVLPEPVSMTPQTVGWVVLGVAVGLALLWLAWLVLRRYRASAYRRAALAELDRLEGALEGSGERARALVALPVLVKRTALACRPRVEVAGLADGEWLRYLDRTLGSTDFTAGPGRLLPTLAYASPAQLETIKKAEVEALTKLLRRWIRKHRV